MMSSIPSRRRSAACTRSWAIFAARVISSPRSIATCPRTAAPFVVCTSADLAGHHRDRELDSLLEELGEQREAIHHGHLEIGEDGIHVLRGEQLERASPVLGGNDSKPSRAIERAAQGTAHEIVIIYEEQVRHWLQDMVAMRWVGTGGAEEAILRAHVVTAAPPQRSEGY